MPLTDRQAEQMQMCLSTGNTVTVLVGPCTGRILRVKAIPTDGRHYQCGGKVKFDNGIEVPAHLELRTHTFTFLKRAWCHHNGVWYGPEEPELFAALGCSAQDALPFTWTIHVPLEKFGAGPFPSGIVTTR